MVTRNGVGHPRREEGYGLPPKSKLPIHRCSSMTHAEQPHERPFSLLLTGSLSPPLYPFRLIKRCRCPSSVSTRLHPRRRAKDGRRVGPRLDILLPPTPPPPPGYAGSARSCLPPAPPEFGASRAAGDGAISARRTGRTAAPPRAAPTFETVTSKSAGTSASPRQGSTSPACRAATEGSTSPACRAATEGRDLAGYILTPPAPARAAPSPNPRGLERTAPSRRRTGPASCRPTAPFRYRLPATRRTTSRVP